MWLYSCLNGACFLMEQNKKKFEKCVRRNKCNNTLVFSEQYGINCGHKNKKLKGGLDTIKTVM